MAKGKGEKFLELMAGLDIAKSQNQITEDLKNIMPDRIKTLDLHAKLDSSDIATLDRYMKGQTISAEKLNRLKKNLIAIQQDEITSRKKGNVVGTESAYVTQQIAEAMAAVAKETGIANLAIKSFEADPFTNKLTKMIIALNGVADSAKKITVTIGDDGQPIFDSKTIASPNLERDLKESVSIIKNAFRDIEKIKTDAISKGTSEDAISVDVGVREASILKETENYYKILKTAKENSLITTEAEISKQKELIDLLKEKRANLENEVQTASSFKADQSAKKSMERLLQLESSMLKIKKEIAMNDKANVASLSADYEVLEKEAETHREILKSSKLINEEFRERNILNLKQTEQGVESKYADKSLGQIEKQSKIALKAYKELEVARQVGDKKTELSAQREYDLANKMIALEYETTAKKLQTAVAIEDYERKFAAMQNQKIDKQIALNEAIDIEVEQRQKSYAVAFGKNDFDGKALPKVEANQAKEISESQEAMSKYVKEIFGAEASILKFNSRVDDTGRYLGVTKVRLDQTGDTYREATIAVDSFNRELVISERVIRSNKAAHASFAEKMQQTFTKLTAYVGVSTLIYGALSKIREGFQFIKDLDKELTNVAITTGMSKDEARDLGEAYSELGIAMGKTTMEIAAANTELIRQGLSLEESERRLEQVIKLSAVGAISTSEALKVITSGVNAMKVSAEELSDVLVNAGQLSASSVEELGEAFQKVASSAYASNMQLTETTSILATMTEVTQEDAGSVGTALKTMIARFNNITDATDGTDEALNKVEEAIESVGVAFTDSQGQVRNLFDILTDLNGVWGGLDQNTRSYIATQAAGTRQQNKFFAVMDNFNRVLDLNNQLLQSSGKLQEGYNVYLESLEAKANSAKAAMDKLWQNEIVPQLIEAASDGIKMLAILIDKVGLFGTALAGLGFSFAASDFKKLWAESTSVITEGGHAATVSGKAFAKLASVGKEAAEGTMKTGAAFKALGGSILTVGKIATATFAKMVLQFAAITIAATLIVGAIKLITDAFNKEKEAIERATKASESLTQEFLTQSQTLSQLGDMSKRYNEIKEKIGSGNARDRLGTAEYQEFLSLNEQINNILPDTSAKTDIYGDKIYNLSQSYNVLNEAMEANLNIKRQDLLDSEDYKTALKERIEDSSKLIGYMDNEIYKLKELEELRAKIDGLKGTKDLDERITLGRYEEDYKAAKKFLKDTREEKEQILESFDSVAFGATFDFSSIYERTLVQAEDFKEKYFKAMSAGETEVDFAKRMKESIDSVKFDSLFANLDTLAQKIEKNGATKEVVTELEDYIKALENVQKQSLKPGTAEFDIYSLAIANASAELEIVKKKLEDIKNMDPVDKALSDFQKFQESGDKLSQAFDKVKDGSSLSVEEIVALRDVSEEAYQIFLKTGDATFANGETLKRIANDQKEAFRTTLISLRENLKQELGITAEKKKQLAIMKAGLRSELRIAEEDSDPTTYNAIQAAIDELDALPKNIATIDALIKSLDQTNVFGSGSRTSSKKEEVSQLEKYFNILKKITRLEQEAALLEFQDQSDSSKLTKQRIENINAQIAAQTELYNARTKHLSTLYAKEKQTNVLSENYADLKNEIKEEEEAIRDIVLERLELEESIVEVIRSNYNLYSTELQGIEIIQARIAVLDAQGLEDSDEKINLTKLLARTESDLATKKRADLDKLLKLSKDITLTEMQRQMIMEDISALQVEILGHEANSASLLKELESIDEDRLAKLEERKTGIRDFYSMVEELVRGELELKVDALEKELQMAKDILDVKMDELDQAKKMDDLEEKRAKRSQELSKIVAKIASLQAAADSGDIKAKNEILKLQEEEKEKRLDIAEEQEDESYDLQKEALQDVYDLTEKGIIETKKQIEDTLNDVSKMQMLVNQRITDSMKDMTRLQQELIKWNRLHGTGIDEDITSKWKTAYDQASDYFKLLEKNKAPFNVNDALNSDLGTQDQTGTGTTNSQSFLDSMKSLMLKNSELYRNAVGSPTMSDAEKTGIMNSAKTMNQVIGKLAGFIFDSTSGVWYTDASKKQRLYDNGGLKPKGETGFMAENVKEWVFDDAQLKAVQSMAISEFMKTNNNLEAGSSNNMINITIEGDVTDDNLNRITNDLKNIVKEVSKGQVEIFRQRGLKPSLKSR